jgi:hypothetical protein
MTLDSRKGESTLDWVNSPALTEERTTIDGVLYDKQSQRDHQRKVSVIKGWKENDCFQKRGRGYFSKKK